jgi:hypothetical protein
MKTLNVIQLILCLAVSAWFGTAAYSGWRTPHFASNQPGNAQHTPGGYRHTWFYIGNSPGSTYSGGSRSTGGSWGGGK